MLKKPKPKDLLSLFLLFITMACLEQKPLSFTQVIHHQHIGTHSTNSSILLEIAIIPILVITMTEKAAQSAGNQTVRPHRKASLLDQPNRMKGNT